MIIIPAIDLKDGKVVRLFQGMMNKENVYSRNPAAVARHWQNEGAKLLHVVDLDGAVEGRPKNLERLKEIMDVATVPVQFGGGLRDRKTVAELFKMGVSRVILGTKAVDDREFLKDVFHTFGEKIMVSIDARNGKVATQAWQQNSADLDVVTFAGQLKALGFKNVIYTDISKDGTLQGPDLEGIRVLMQKTGLRVIASGGVSSLEDLRKLKELAPQGVTGVIVGKALYEEKFTLKQALRELN